MREANYRVVQEAVDGKPLILRDIGPWDRYMTITNAAEWVVEDCIKRCLLAPNGTRLLYYDSENELSELKVKDGYFAGFAFPREESGAAV